MRTRLSFDFVCHVRCWLMEPRRFLYVGLAPALSWRFASFQGVAFRSRTLSSGFSSGHKRRNLSGRLVANERTPGAKGHDDGMLIKLKEKASGLQNNLFPTFP